MSKFYKNFNINLDEIVAFLHNVLHNQTVEYYIRLYCSYIQFLRLVSPTFYFYAIFWTQFANVLIYKAFLSSV